MPALASPGECAAGEQAAARTPTAIVVTRAMFTTRRLFLQRVGLAVGREQRERRAGHDACRQRKDAPLGHQHLAHLVRRNLAEPDIHNTVALAMLQVEL